MAGGAPALILDGSGLAPAALALVGSRSRLTASVTQSGERWNATIPLLASRWGSAASAPPSGRYHFAPPLRCRSGTLPSPPLVPGAFRIAFDAAESATAVVFSAPLTDEENGKEQQAGSKRATAALTLRRSTPCSSRASTGRTPPATRSRSIVRSRDARPDITRYWSVATPRSRCRRAPSPSSRAARSGGASAARRACSWSTTGCASASQAHATRTCCRPGTAPCSRGSRSTGRAQAAARAARPCANARAGTSCSRRIATATRIFRSAYVYRGPIWEEGYPRDDVLLTRRRARRFARSSASRMARRCCSTRRPGGTTGPIVDHLDLSSFTEQLGDGYVTLIRGHSRTLQPGHGRARRRRHRRHELPRHVRAVPGRRRARHRLLVGHVRLLASRASRSSSSPPTSSTTATSCAASTSTCSPWRPARWCATPTSSSRSCGTRMHEPRRIRAGTPPGARASTRATTATRPSGSSRAC